MNQLEKKKVEEEMNQDRRFIKDQGLVEHDVWKAFYRFLSPQKKEQEERGLGRQENFVTLFRPEKNMQPKQGSWTEG